MSPGTRLLAATTPLKKAEPYGDRLTFDSGDHQLWKTVSSRAVLRKRNPTIGRSVLSCSTARRIGVIYAA